MAGMVGRDGALGVEGGVGAGRYTGPGAARLAGGMGGSAVLPPGGAW